MHINTTEATKDVAIINYEVEISQDTGIPGVPGTTFIPSISEDGILSWTNTSNLENPPDFNLYGIDTVKSINEKTGEVVLESSDIQYTTDVTIKDALDTALHVPIKITSFTGGNPVYEIGQSIRNIQLKWELTTDDPLSQTINNGIGTVSNKVRSFVINSPIETNKVYSLEVTDTKGNTNRADFSISFVSKYYYGTSKKKTLDNEDVLKLTGSLSTDYNNSYSFDCSNGSYFYFVIPEKYSPVPEFRIGGILYTDLVQSSLPVTNQYGHTETYRIYRSGTIMNGNHVPVEIHQRV